MTPTPRANGPPLGTTPQPSTTNNDPAFLQRPGAGTAKDNGRSLSANSFATVAKQAQSYGGRSVAAPGSFTSELKSFNSRNDLSRVHTVGTYGAEYDDGDPSTTSEQKQAQFRDRIDKEMKIKVGTENLLEALNSKNAKQARDQRKVVELELNLQNRKIAQLKSDLEAEIKKAQEQAPMSPKGRLSQLFRAAPVRIPSYSAQQTPGVDQDIQSPIAETESPTYTLAEILRALEQDGMQADYYVSQANDLVDLFKRHPTLKYDLAWSIFGLRMQMMMLSDSREVVAAGYRVTRYAITDRKSLQTIRALHTDFLVILSLVKESKARVEREQALKFIRAFLDVKGGVREIHPAVVRIVVAVADHQDDQLRSIAILTLAEMLLKEPTLVVNAGGLSVLSEAMGSGIYFAPETLIDPFLHLMDLPARRGLLKSGFEFSTAFASFTEPILSHAHEEKLKASARVVAALFKSWPGLMTLSLHDFLPVRSVVSSLYVTHLAVRTATLDLLIDILRIKSPSWSTSFIGGRRLTTYGRVTNLKSDTPASQTTNRRAADEAQKRSLVRHFTAVSLAVLLRQGLLKGLMHAEADAPTQAMKRRTSLLTAEVLRMASELLPSSWSYGLQALPGLFESATNFASEERFQSVATVYQVDSINRTLYRSASGQDSQGKPSDESTAARARATSKTQVNAVMDETQFRAKMIDTQILNTVNYTKWDWSLIHELIDGPMVNPKRLQEAMITSKFVHRLLGFLRPFKYRFSDAPNTKSNQRYVRTACALLKLLLQSTEGARYLESNKLIPQIGECLAQQDPMSGITSKTPLFSPERMAETLVAGYFGMLGVMCSDSKGMQILEKWKIINIFYHIVELKHRDDLIRALLINLDYTLDSHPRIILSKAMIASSKQMRMMATRILRKYAMMAIENTIIGGGVAEWAIKLLVAQLYDPEIEVCEVAIKILEEACNDIRSLEYVVKCRPALDHLGEIGAPLLLRFLSTSVGYHYLDGLDYITKEMDDWFLGRNDTYVTIVEASLARALSDMPEQALHPQEEGPEPQDFGYVPPHFYRELTRTAEGCELLKAKGHFIEFAATIQDFAMEDDDPETILKVKGCLWAVGNVGSMERGAPFLEQTDVVKYIVQIAEESQVMTLRGTAFFVLGLLSRSVHGQEILIDYGWDGTTSITGESLGYVLPLDFDKLFSLTSRTSMASKATSMLIRTRRSSVEDADPTNNGILNSIVKLGNTVLTNKALAELNGYRAKKAPGFQKPNLFRKAMVLLASHAYRIPQYRFVIDLWDKGVLRQIVLKDVEASSDEDSDSEADEDEGDAKEAAV
ncbi:target of rapamycin complex 2 subunit ste20-like [Teratosphaeria destructans]|uniref:Target of rapamycin complex 2 subunit ste20-like n=1 Tax=Teratosphaeria destructans TaxID=418781 RepID=A0A9W7SW45_9PEZI|nr:target of rapamycin complex 2 subunit ste20-like [Teratosphaeria destructans]